MAMGWNEQNRRWLEDANRVDPGNTYVKIDYLLTLRPRWGGSLEEMQAFVDESKGLLQKQEDKNLLQSHVWRSHAFVRWKDHKDYQGCIDYYSKAIELYEKDMRPFARRGYCYQMLKRYEEALRDYSHVISIEPRHEYAHRSRGAVLRDLGRFDEAIADLIRETELNPNDGYAWRNLGYIYYSTEKFDKSFASYQKGAERGDADCQQSLGFLYRFGKGVQKDPDKAIYWWKKKEKNGNAQAIHSLQLEGVLP
jgi:tetratricopeptide (TPR) repeat protein